MLSFRNANAAAEAASSKAPASDMSKWRLYVGSVHFSLSEDDVKQIFEPFGPVEFLHLHKDAATGRSKGYAFLQYKFEKDARMAAEQMNGFEIAGRQVRRRGFYCHLFVTIINDYFFSNRLRSRYR